MTTKTEFMVSLGGYRFKSNVNPYQAMTRTKNYDFASRPRWQGLESLQFKGQKAPVITMSIKVVIEKASDREILPTLEKLGDEGKALRFISPSEGGNLGLWVITGFSQKDGEFTRSGIALEQEAQLTIKRFAE